MDFSNVNNSTQRKDAVDGGGVVCAKAVKGVITVKLPVDHMLFHFN